MPLWGMAGRRGRGVNQHNFLVKLLYSYKIFDYFSETVFELINLNIASMLFVLNCFTYEQIYFFKQRFTSCSEVGVKSAFYRIFKITAFSNSAISGLLAYYIIHNSNHKNGCSEFRYFFFSGGWVSIFNCQPSR